MHDPSPDIEKQLTSANSKAEVRNLFSTRIRALGYDWFDASSLHAAMLSNPRKAARFFVCDYYDGDPWKYLPRGWPSDDQLTIHASRSSAPIDYLAYLKSCDDSVSILIQRGMLKTWGVRHAWLFPHNTLGNLRAVTCYMCGNEKGSEAVFRETRNELTGLTALLIDRLEHLHQAEQQLGEVSLGPDRMPIALTELETTCLILLSRGRSNHEIAEKMGVTIHTVRFHLKKIYKKMGVSSRVEAVSIAIDHGYVTRQSFSCSDRVA